MRRLLATVLAVGLFAVCGDVTGPEGAYVLLMVGDQELPVVLVQVMDNKLAYVIGTSQDDASDDAQFNWVSVSGMNPLSHMTITYYNDGSPSEIPGSFTDTYPSPWTGTAPVVYRDVHLFRYTMGFTVSLTITDDDKGTSTAVVLSVS